MGDVTPPQICPHCHAESLYQTKSTVASYATLAFQLLPGLGGLYMWVVVCSACGFMQFFADAQARKNLPSSDRWRKQ